MTPNRGCLTVVELRLWSILRTPMFAYVWSFLIDPSCPSHCRKTLWKCVWISRAEVKISVKTEFVVVLRNLPGHRRGCYSALMLWEALLQKLLGPATFIFPWFQLSTLQKEELPAFWWPPQQWHHRETYSSVPQWVFMAGWAAKAGVAFGCSQQDRSDPRWAAAVCLPSADNPVYLQAYGLHLASYAERHGPALVRQPSAPPGTHHKVVGWHVREV